jgi:hypothetical protein
MINTLTSPTSGLANIGFTDTNQPFPALSLKLIGSDSVNVIVLKMLTLNLLRISSTNRF